jgi:hypothetical protein
MGTLPDDMANTAGISMALSLPCSVLNTTSSPGRCAYQMPSPCVEDAQPRSSLQKLAFKPTLE